MNKDKAKYVSIAQFATETHPLQSIVYMLRDYYDKGENVYVEYNDYKLYSADNLTLEQAFYLLGLGNNMSFDEWKKQVENDKINEYINAGIGYLPQKKQETWKEMVHYCFEHGYGERVIKQVIAIMDMLAAHASQEEIDKFFDNYDNSGGSRANVISLLQELVGIDIRDINAPSHSGKRNGDSNIGDR